MWLVSTILYSTDLSLFKTRLYFNNTAVFIVVIVILLVSVLLSSHVLSLWPLLSYRLLKCGVLLYRRRTLCLTLTACLYLWDASTLTTWRTLIDMCKLSHNYIYVFYANVIMLVQFCSVIVDRFYMCILHVCVNKFFFFSFPSLFLCSFYFFSVSFSSCFNDD